MSITGLISRFPSWFGWKIPPAAPAALQVGWNLDRGARKWRNYASKFSALHLLAMRIKRKSIREGASGQDNKPLGRYTRNATTIHRPINNNRRIGNTHANTNWALPENDLLLFLYCSTRPRYLYIFWATTKVSARRGGKRVYGCCWFHEYFMGWSILSLTARKRAQKAPPGQRVILLNWHFGEISGVGPWMRNSHSSYKKIGRKCTKLLSDF